MSTLPAELAAWKDRGSFHTIFGHDVFALTHGDPAAPTLVVLHGFPSSSFDFHLVLDHFAERYHVVLHDHLGFGLSAKPQRYSYSLIEQAEVAVELWRKLGIRKAHLLAHDYGTSVTTEILARRLRGLLPIDLCSITLCNGSIHLELAQLTPSQVILRNQLLGPLFAHVVRPTVFKAQVRRIFGRKDALSDNELDLMWAGITHDGGVFRLPQISSYLDERIRFYQRWIGALTQLDLPAHILWGKRDPVAIAAIATQLAAEIPHAHLQWLDDLGHYPMLEDPLRWAQAARNYLDQLETAPPPPGKIPQ